MQACADGDGQQSFQQETHTWRLRDSLAAALLFLGTAGFVLWQNARVAVLWDLGYLLDTSWRIALGQMPYRDFPLVHPPLTFLIQAGIVRLAGRHYALVIAYAAVAGGLGTLLAWRIMLRVLRRAHSRAAGVISAWWMSLMLALPLISLGIYSVYPHPIYDCDCALAIMVALLLILRIEEGGASPRAGCVVAFLAGIATVVPVFFKQNIGLPFLMVAATGAVMVLVTETRGRRSLCIVSSSKPAWMIGGMLAAGCVAVAVVACTAGLGNYLHWTIDFAAQRRLPGLSRMLSVYREPSLLWMLPALGAGLLLCDARVIARPWLRVLGLCLLSAPFASRLVLLASNSGAADRADQLLALWPVWLLISLFTAGVFLLRGITLGGLLPFYVLAAIHGTLMSQQLWGSTYALWPLLMVLIAQVFGMVVWRSRAMALYASAVVSGTLLVCGTLYALSLERLSYVDIPDGPVVRSQVPVLRGMADRGPFVANLEELVAFTNRDIAMSDGVISLPGEDPFFYATGRTPQFPITLFDPTTDPYSAAELFAEARRRNIRWVVVKRVLQIDESPLLDAGQTMQLLSRDFSLYRRLQGYDIYRRR